MTNRTPYHIPPFGPTIPTWPGLNPPPYGKTEPVLPAYYPVQSGTNDNLIVIILDESSSMYSCYEQTCSGFDEFIDTHKNANESKAGKAFVTLITFNGNNVRTRFENKSIHEVPKLRDVYTPSGGTNLLDAIGDTLHKVNNTLTNIPLAYRPGVTVVIFTDGEENSSRTYNNAKISEMVTLSEKAEWTFTFFGANIDAFAVGNQFGMRRENIMQYDTNKMENVFATASASMLNTRVMKVSGVSTEQIYNTMYSDDDRKNVK